MNKSLKIVFFGTPDFAVASLDAVLKEGWNIVGVITAPDRKSGRGQNVNFSAVKVFALKHKLLLLQPRNLKDPVFIAQLKALKADLHIVVAFRMLPEVVWKMPKHGTFNLHASLLPAYRGAAPINWAIINGENTSGVTTFFLKHEIDTGNIAFQEKVTISNEDNAGSLHDKLMLVGSKLVLKTLEALNNNTLTLKAQEDYTQDAPAIPKAPKIFRNDCQIDWFLPANEVYNKIRGLSPYPGAWTSIQVKEGDKCMDLKIYKSAITKEKVKNNASAILKIDEKRIFVSTGDYWLELIELQLQGKKRMNSIELLNGFALEQFKIQ
ncbi:MAG: methionyl-tRNA formyltransferase [Verrucomicrobia bacterium]|nr:methionyl-tRNA formyltransferase [Verrucomicrobiota bacterium]